MRTAFAVAMLVTLACGGGSDATAPNPASDSIAGTFTLRTVNGSPLPFTTRAGATTVVFISGVLTVAEGGTWSDSRSFTLSGFSETTTDGGTWTRAGTNVAFLSTTKTGYAGTFTGSGFNLTDFTFNYTFSK